MADLSLTRSSSAALAGRMATCGSELAQVVTPKGFIARAIAAWRQRQHLDRLDAHMLKDIGLTKDDVTREIARPVWDVPSTWRY